VHNLSAQRRKRRKVRFRAESGSKTREVKACDEKREVALWKRHDTWTQKGLS